MENIVWAIFGVMAFLLAIGILVNLVVSGVDDRKLAVSRNAVSELGQWCRTVCGSDIESRLSKEITMASGSEVKAEKSGVCMSFGSWRECSDCICDLNTFYLNLNKPEILQMYESHKFACTFERQGGGVVAIDCKG
ncbi:MAG: hypothetical protein QXK06_04530 [Candidatus Diapherotrites archaeon]